MTPLRDDLVLALRDGPKTCLELAGIVGTTDRIARLALNALCERNVLRRQNHRGGYRYRLIRNEDNYEVSA